MWCPEDGWTNAARTLDRVRSAREVVAHVGRRTTMQFAVPIPVIAELMTLVGHALDEVRPFLDVAAEHEERGRHTFPFEDVEDQRCRPRIRPVVEGNARDGTRF